MSRDNNDDAKKDSIYSIVLAPSTFLSIEIELNKSLEYQVSQILPL